MIGSMRDAIFVDTPRIPSAYRQSILMEVCAATLRRTRYISVIQILFCIIDITDFQQAIVVSMEIESETV